VRRPVLRFCDPTRAGRRRRRGRRRAHNRCRSRCQCQPPHQGPSKIARSTEAKRPTSASHAPASKWPAVPPTTSTTSTRTCDMQLVGRFWVLEQLRRHRPRKLGRPTRGPDPANCIKVRAAANACPSLHTRHATIRPRAFRTHCHCSKRTTSLSSGGSAACRIANDFTKIFLGPAGTTTCLLTQNDTDYTRIPTYGSPRFAGGSSSSSTRRPTPTRPRLACQ